MITLKCATSKKLLEIVNGIPALKKFLIDNNLKIVYSNGNIKYVGKREDKV